MKLSRASTYALYAVSYMAAQKHTHPIASHLIAQAQKIPELFLLKVLKSLVSARILTSVKGPNGGYRLARTPRDISALEIIEAVDGPIRGEVPPIEADGEGKLDRRLSTVCNEVAESVRNRLQKVTIASLATKG